MKDLRVALVVPDQKLPTAAKRRWMDALHAACRSSEVDLVVFPESYEDAALDSAIAVARTLADDFNVPVLAGVETHEGFQTAAYFNPNPFSGETASHLYIKHSSAAHLAFERRNYRGRRDPMFKPICLGGQRLGVMICHDMFYGLITDIYLEKEATGLFDLTGGDVRLAKWRNIVQGRSIELGGPFFCTMARGENVRAQAGAIAFRNGLEQKPITSHLGPEGTGGFAIFPLSPGAGKEARLESSDRFSSHEQYKDIRVSLGGRGFAHVAISVSSGKAKVEGQASTGLEQRWHGFKLPAGHTGVLCLPLKELWSPRRLYEMFPSDGAFAHHIVVYFATETPADPERVLALARLRAIEHRIAVGILAGGMREMLKTNTWKSIQRFRPNGDVFGLDARNLRGTRSACAAGISVNLIDAYLELV
jgi:hypothetical protein